MAAIMVKAALMASFIALGVAVRPIPLAVKALPAKASLVEAAPLVTGIVASAAVAVSVAAVAPAVLGICGAAAAKPDEGYKGDRKQARFTHCLHLV